MHTYTPSKTSIRQEWNRKTRYKKQKSTDNNNIPCNSEPWAQCEYKNLHDLLVVVDNIAKVETQWQSPSKIS